jgi:hypothetical protein
MLSAANAFLAGLDPAQRSQATYALTDSERENWNFVPIARQGLPLKAMSPAQREAAIHLLRSGLGQAGWERAEAVISLENVLKALENGSAKRDPTLYYVTIFGAPSDSASWGWRFEGHHLSFNFTIIDGTHVFFVPSFIGSNPAEVLSGPRQGLRVERAEDEEGRAFMRSLDDAQRKIALVATEAPKELLAGNSRRITPLAPTGILGSQLTPDQKQRLSKLIQLYLARLRPELAEGAWQEISRSGLDKVAFAWAGGIERGTGSYYRIQTPTFLIEFDNTQNNANHIHTCIRQFKGDFGEDLLREHYAAEHRPQ